MQFSQELSWSKFEAIIKANLPFREGWKNLIDFHEQQKPKPYWPAMREFDFEKEQLEIKNWLQLLSQTAPLNKNVVALWFGLSKFMDEDTGQEFYATYITGCDTYDSEHIEWATEPVYVPEERYFISEIYNSIEKQISSKDEDYSFFDWLLPLAYYALQLNDITRNNLNTGFLLKHQAKLFIACGHDGGDYINLQPIKRS